MSTIRVFKHILGVMQKRTSGGQKIWWWCNFFACL